MIDHVFKRQMNALWDNVARAFVRMGATPDAVTLTSAVCVVAASLLFLWHRDFFWFGFTVGLFELLDNIDGAIARVANSATPAGAFLDSATDRLKEIAMFTVVGVVSGALLPAMLALSGGMAASYNLARGQAEGARAIDRWPPLFERLERIALLCIAAALTSVVPPWRERPIIEWALWLLAIGSHVTALQRLVAGYVLLRRR